MVIDCPSYTIVSNANYFMRTIDPNVIDKFNSEAGFIGVTSYCFERYFIVVIFYRASRVSVATQIVILVPSVRCNNPSSST